MPGLLNKAFTVSRKDFAFQILILIFKIKISVFSNIHFRFSSKVLHFRINALGFSCRNPELKKKVFVFPNKT